MKLSGKLAREKRLTMSRILEHDNAAGEAGPVEPGKKGRARLFAAGGIVGALLASSCCIAPLVLVLLGASGAWMASLTALAPYKPYFLTLAAVFLAAGFRQVYAGPKSVCAEGSDCTRPASNRMTKTVLWTATVLVLLSATVNLWAPAFY